MSTAKEFFAAIEADEKRWIAEGVDVDAAFAAKYYDSLDSTIDAAQKQLSKERRDVRGNPYQEAIHRGMMILAAIVIGIGALIWVWIRLFRRSRSLSTD